MNSGRDWSDLPPEILVFIARKLSDICDYIRFRGVCVSWHLAAGPTDLGSQLPWLVAPTLTEGCSHTEDNRITKISFFNCHGQPICLHLQLPETQAKWIYGSPHGWLLMIGSPPSVSLLNPITGANITLPFLPRGLIDLHNHIRKAVLCSHPTSSRPRQILVAIWTDNNLAFYKQGDNEWTIIQCFSAFDMVHYKDEIYFVGGRGSLSLLKVESLTINVLIHSRPLEDQFYLSMHLVEVAGDLLLVAWYMTKFGCRIMNLGIFKLNKSANGELNWVSIGNFTLGLVSTSAVVWTQSVCALALPVSGGYRIYFTDAVERISFIIRELHAIPDIGIVEQPCCQAMKDIDPQRRPSSLVVTWMVPNLY